MLVGRCIPLIRSLVSIPAGFRRMNFGIFTLYTAIGSLVWNTVLIGAGYILRDNWEDVEPVLDVVQYVVIALDRGGDRVVRLAAPPDELDPARLTSTTCVAAGAPTSGDVPTMVRRATSRRLGSAELSSRSH